MASWALTRTRQPGPVVLGLEGLGAGATQDRSQLEHRAGHPEAPTTGTRAGQGVTGPTRAGRVGPLGAAPQDQRRGQLGQHLGIDRGGGLGDTGG